MKCPTLRQMRIFVAVAESESLSMAGRSLNLTPATLSDALRDLEAILGKEVFDRSGRRLRLSPLGVTMLPYAKRILRDMDHVMQRYGKQSILMIAASVTVGNYILPSCISRFLSNRNGCEIIVDVRNTDAVIELLLDHKVEAGFVEGKVAHADLDVQAWRTDPLVIVAAPDHPLAHSSNIEDIARAPWVLREHGSGTRQSFDAVTETWPVKPYAMLTVGGNELLKSSVKSGLGLGCLSRSAVLSEIGRGELVVIDAPGTPIDRTLSIVVHNKIEPRDFLKTFMESCRSSS